MRNRLHRLLGLILVGGLVGDAPLFARGLGGDGLLCQRITSADYKSLEGAVGVAEQFVKANRLDTERPCPSAIEGEENSQGEYDEEPPPCQDYAASESSAYGVINLEEAGWLVYFRKKPRQFAADGGEYMRRINIYFNGPPAVPMVCLDDLEGTTVGITVLKKRDVT